MGIFSRTKKTELNALPPDTIIKGEALSTWRLELPKHSNLPTVWSNKGSMAVFGEDNLYPNLIEQTLQMSPVHNACYQFINGSVIGGGYEFINYNELPIKDRTEIKTFESRNKLKKLVKMITKDYLIHRRINLLVIKDNKGVITFERINPSRVRYNKAKDTFYVSEDYTMMSANKVYKRYHTGCEPNTYMIEFDDIEDSYAPYAMPNWASAMTSIKLNAKIDDFQDANCENSINPSLVVLKPQLFETQEERAKYIGDLRKQKGVDQTGNILLFSAPNKEQLPEITQLEANKNGDLFVGLRESTIENICFGWGINPVLIGQKTPGSLGVTHELDIAMKKAKVTVINPAKEHIEETLNMMLELSNISNTLIINNFDIYDFKTTEE